MSIQNLRSSLEKKLPHLLKWLSLLLLLFCWVSLLFVFVVVVVVTDSLMADSKPIIMLLINFDLSRQLADERGAEFL